MRLTVYTDLSLRLLMYLALKQDGLATIAEVSRAYGISKNHMMKVAHELGVAGYVATVRGKGGGLRLARAAETINLGEVVRHTEPDLALVPCFHPINAVCAIRPICVLKNAVDEARRAFFSSLEGRTLAELVRPGPPLRAALRIAEPIDVGLPGDPPAAPVARGGRRARPRAAAGGKGR
ncbi:MAG: Rrf2 family transcriptional regulator [Variibacter sp.]|nr:Rrf2 family transcriptional regulator [Variibacter sp.]